MSDPGSIAIQFLSQIFRIAFRLLIGAAKGIWFLIRMLVKHMFQKDKKDPKEHERY